MATPLLFIWLASHAYVRSVMGWLWEVCLGRRSGMANRQLARSVCSSPTKELSWAAVEDLGAGE